MRKTLLRRARRGGISIVTLGVCFAIIVFFLMFLELQQFFDAQYNVEVRCQRAVNSCLEYFMDDRMRSDGYNCLCTSVNGMARLMGESYTIEHADGQGKGLYAYLDDALGITNWSGSKTQKPSTERSRKDANGETIYTVQYGSPTYQKGYDGVANRGQDASIIVDVTVTLHTGLAKYMGLNGFKWTQTFTSTNFRTDGNERG